MVVGIGVAGLGVLGRDDVDRQAVLGVHEDQAAVLGRLLHGTEDRAVVAEEDAGVGGEELEVGHALLNEGVHLGEGRIGDVAHDHVEAVVDRRLALGLGVPRVEALAQRLALALDGEVDDRRRAAEGRRASPGLERVLGEGPAERQLHVGVHVDRARDDPLAVRVDRPVRGDVELLADDGDPLAVHQHVGRVGGIGVDDRPALDQGAHRLLRHRLTRRECYRPHRRTCTLGRSTSRDSWIERIGRIRSP